MAVHFPHCPVPWRRHLCLMSRRITWSISATPCYLLSHTQFSCLHMCTLCYVPTLDNSCILVMHRLTTRIRSEKCVVRRFRRCAKVIECTYTNLDSIAYNPPRLYVGWSFNSGTDVFVSEWVDLPASWSCLLQNSVLVLVCTYSSAPATHESTSGSQLL